jgi:Outer membrane protein beta-barrel domain
MGITRITNRAVVALAAGSLWAAALPAQRPVSLGVGGGVSLPTGTFGGAAQAGWHALGALVLSSPMQPLGLRVEGTYHHFALDDAVTAASGARTVAAATGNVTYRLPATRSAFSPYVITGLGAYRAGCAGDTACDATTRFGWNAGLGTRWYLRGVRGFVEARYHRTTSGGAAVPWVPVTFGLLL